VGARLLWFYRGRGTLGPVVERYAPLGTAGCVGTTYLAARPRDRGGRPSGGLIVPVGARPGRRVGFALDLATPRGNWGVVIRYTLRAGAGASTPTVGAVSVASSGGHTLPAHYDL